MLDGHFSHVYNIDLIELCRINNIALLCLPSGQTSKLQPLDVMVFGLLKGNYYVYEHISAR